MIDVGIVGCSGYVGELLLRLVNEHPHARVAMAVSSSLTGRKVSDIYPDIPLELEFVPLSGTALSKTDLVLTAVPHGSAAGIVDDLDTRVIDMSADHRMTHTYGLPEIYADDIPEAGLVANPGCYATASILSTHPIRELVNTVVLDCISGYSGGGRSDPHAHSGNIIAYSLTDHFHGAEIRKILGTEVAFTPHVVDVFSGIMCTAHVTLKEHVELSDIMDLYRNAYMGSMTQVVEGIPCTLDVVNTPYAHVGGITAYGERGLVVVSVIDNLMKGAASQAIENMNLMFGLPRGEGLE